MITFEFFTPKSAANTPLTVPSVELLSTAEGDFFELDYRNSTTRTLPENFYLQEAPDLRPEPSVDTALEFLRCWGHPTTGVAHQSRVRVNATDLGGALSTVGQFGRFATDWFEADKQLPVPSSLHKVVEEALTDFRPRLRVGGSGDSGVAPLALAVAQWADDVVNDRSLRVCDFCGGRFTKQRGRSTSGRYRLDDRTRFCSHSCSNREGNRRRRVFIREASG
jgi:hypothetical protein